MQSEESAAVSVTRYLYRHLRYIGLHNHFVKAFVSSVAAAAINATRNITRYIKKQSLFPARHSFIH
jgi:hypothetical protein